ncbi:putative DNA polymerase delta subunit 4 [Aspergillus clavatus NRRL 1]|uniref:DNA polymerase delta subunit 4, putative n=1 Tax=Aspergillus clavatus (strain ATCC 1007 / CBS 513.65 / DSM 816 / NCTC 3887 / NRRL 1 / QM 1276 / 107) TaxID=344612 RepID=A1CTU7_ASPCL|nr:DNA polymerase delta subunit 4, putative [Aspergillus clavatus NRRL 1]EAW06734.1 DNA polymerase delta subunit 4, putative [Aspergillus clavatus NRRL 1]
MPTTRRRGGNTAARSQSTISFGSKSRVTKPSATTRSQKTKDLEPISAAATSTEEVSEPEQVPVAPSEPSKPHVAELAVRHQAQKEIQQPLSEEDQRAIKITEQELQRYWQQEEAKRRGPRVHQEDLSVHEKILRHFDLSSQYGPCIGIARLKRWRRANMLKLNPPIEVLAVLLKEKETVKQRAYVDELMS